jgi:uncharacterized protein
MIRVGLNNTGRPVISGTGKQSGRGSYVCVNFECVARAKKTGGLSRALRAEIPPSIYGELELEIEDRQKVSSG